MKYISFCSGIEAATVAWHPLGWEPIAFAEIDKFPSKVLAHHYPNVPNLGDFTAVDWQQWACKADVCVGGTPCQAFSVAGLRKSLQDERGNLSLEFIRAINIIRPRYVVWENVPGVLSTSDNAFGCFLGALVGSDEALVCKQGWPNAGVVDGPERSACWRVLDAQYFGLAQRRKRVFVVASSGDGPHPAEILFEWESMRRDSPPRREAGEGTARGIEIGPSGGSFTDLNPTLDSRCKDGPIRNQLAGAVAMCLNAKGGGGRIDAESETFVATGQGYWSESDTAATLGTEARSLYESTAVTHSLRADGFDASEDGTGRGTPLVPISWDEDLNPCVNFSGTMSRGGDGGRHAGVAVPVLHENDDIGLHRCDCGGEFIGRMDTVCPHCGDFRMGTVTYSVHGTQDPCVDKHVAFALGRNNGGENAVMSYAIQAGALRENPDSGPDGVGVQSDHAYTLGARAEVQAVATLAIRGRGDEQNLEYRTDGTANALLTPNGGRAGIGVGAIQNGMAVRRLTPTECARLQGFPDDYLDLPGAAEGNKYKALGNSMAVPCMSWLGRRIMEVENGRSS